MINVLPVGAPARKKLDSIRAQIVEIDEQLDDIEMRGTILPIEEAVENAIAAMGPLLDGARRRLMGYRTVASARPEGLQDLFALFTDDELRKRFAALLKADGRGEGVPAGKREQRHAALRAQRTVLIEEAYLSMWELMEQGLYVDVPTDHVLSPGQLLRVAEELA